MDICTQLGNRQQPRLHPRQKPHRRQTFGTNSAARVEQHPSFDNGKFSAGALWRVVAKQNRYSKGQGNIVGQDIGASSGFGVLSLNAGWKFSKYATLQAGIDNVFNKTYAEFVSKGGDPSAGTQTLRVDEPGRTAWLRLQAKF